MQCENFIAICYGVTKEIIMYKQMYKQIHVKRKMCFQAYQMRPSIIFFDEIDGLAPVRSSRQDQIHSSIVSTLLALMDGLDSRGEIVVIGATNRIDSIDPALRRPGRFDREFLFPLPSQEVYHASIFFMSVSQLLTF